MYDSPTSRETVWVCEIWAISSYSEGVLCMHDKKRWAVGDFEVGYRLPSVRCNTIIFCLLVFTFAELFFFFFTFYCMNKTHVWAGSDHACSQLSPARVSSELHGEGRIWILTSSPEEAFHACASRRMQVVQNGAQYTARISWRLVL